MRIPSGCSKNDKSIIIDKVKGLIFGAILGDSLGLATEGMTKEDILKIYKNGPIRFGMEDEEGIPFLRDDYRSSFDENDFGGDTEQQLLLLRCLLDNDGVFYYKEYAKSLEEYSKEGIKGLQKKPIGINRTNQAVVAHPEFHDNPHKAAADVWQKSNSLRGANGAIVRAAILGIPKFWDGTTVIENTTNCCRLTHPDPRCMMSCVIVSTLIARILRGQDLEKEENESINNIILPLTPTDIPTTTKSNYEKDSLSLHPNDHQLILNHHTHTTNTTNTNNTNTNSNNNNHHHPNNNHPNNNNNNNDTILSATISSDHLTPPPLSPSSLCFSNTFVTDTNLLGIVRNVIETNKSILTAPNTDPIFKTPETNEEQTRFYYQQLLDTCYFFDDTSFDFNTLQLDNVEDGRHAFKCLSAGLYAFTRHIPNGQETDTFKQLIMDLVMQGGEADTNATVAAALLGVRIGYNQLPSEWVVGLKRWEWLEDLIEEFCTLL
ncbi:unnamed protein product [Cunninghamella blakesleeana]